jgi:hypothetical protein
LVGIDFLPIFVLSINIAVMELNKKVKISFQEDVLHIELEEKESFINEDGHLLIEYIEEALGDYKDGIVECNEINGNMHHGGLWINGTTGGVYIWSPADTRELKVEGKTTIEPSGDMMDYVDLNIVDNLEFLKWYFSTQDEQDAIQNMYELCGWVVTDIDTYQGYKEIEKDQVYIFREMRDEELYESEMRMDEYDWHDVVATCEHFGYKQEEITQWWENKENIPLILECFFELES